MKKTENGYEFGDGQIKIHPNVNDPLFWHITARSIGVIGLPICEKTVSEKVLQKIVYLFLFEKREIINGLIILTK